MMMRRMVGLLFIEVSAFHTFAWAEAVLSRHRSRRRRRRRRPQLVRYVRADETPHVDYLRTALTEMRDRTFVGERQEDPRRRGDRHPVGRRARAVARCEPRDLRAAGDGRDRARGLKATPAPPRSSRGSTRSDRTCASQKRGPAAPERPAVAGLMRNRAVLRCRARNRSSSEVEVVGCPYRSYAAIAWRVCASACGAGCASDRASAPAGSAVGLPIHLAGVNGRVGLASRGDRERVGRDLTTCGSNACRRRRPVHCDRRWAIAVDVKPADTSERCVRVPVGVFPHPVLVPRPNPNPRAATTTTSPRCGRDSTAVLPLPCPMLGTFITRRPWQVIPSRPNLAFRRIRATT